MRAATHKKKKKKKNAKSQGMYAIFDLTRRYGNENGNGRSATSGTLGKFWANKRQGFTFCVTVDANWSN